MFGAAFGAISGGTSNSGYAVDMSGGIKGMGERLQQAAADRRALLDSSDPFNGPNPMSPTPNIPMSESYNSAASSPVFPPAAQERAASVFGTNDQRQASTSGFKQEVKERIMKDISSL
jgi:hypothetical protein